MRSVARGLSLARLGLWWVVISVALLTAEAFALEPLKLVETFRKNPWAGQVYGWAMALTALSAFAGLGIAIVGRCHCLATPNGMPVARTRIRFAVILEACGWGSALANVFVGYAVAFRLIPMPMIVGAVTGGFSLFLLVAGRVRFLRFTSSLAESVNPALVPLARRCLMLSVLVVACVLAAVGLYQLADHSLTPPGLAYPLSGGGTFGAATLAVAGLFVYSRLLRRLRDSLTWPSQLTGHESAEEQAAPPRELEFVAH